MRARLFGAALAIVLSACGDEGEGLRVSGDTGYVRCLAAGPPEQRSWRVGSLQIRVEGDRAMRIDDAPSSWRLAAFSGPIDGGAIRALRELRPHVGLVLGGVGDDPAEAGQTLAALAELGVPVLVVAGGADRSEVMERAFARLDGSAKDRVIAASALRSIRIGEIELVPLAGAPDGRYAITNDACGFASADARAVAGALDPPADGVHRYVASWAGPRESSGLGSVAAGSALVSDVIARTSSEGALFAWPREGAGSVSPDPLRVAVRPLAGPWIVRADGTREAPGATLLTARAQGLVTADDSP